MGKNIISFEYSLAYMNNLLHFCRVISQSKLMDLNNYLIFNTLIVLILTT